jgi:hypothetical protein
MPAFTPLRVQLASIMNGLSFSSASASAPRIFTTTLAFLGGLAAIRVLYELIFPSGLWLGRPVPALLLASGAAAIGWWCHGHPSPVNDWDRAAALLPLALNLLYLFDPAVDVLRSRLIFVATLWLAGVLSARRSIGRHSQSWQDVGLVAVAALPVYLLTMPNTVGRADTFEFQVVAPRLGIAHPTGYPLYLLLGKLFSLLPAGSVAWRLNLGSAVFALGGVGLVYLICRRLSGRPALPILSAAVLGVTPTFWSQAIEAEVYTLHALLAGLAIWLMISILGDREAKMRQWPFIALSLAIGLGLTNHLTTAFLIPPAALSIVLANWKRRPFRPFRTGLVAGMLFTFVIPLLLYLYLPIRWAAVNGESMGLERFLEWVLGSRFKGALQWGAWLADPARYQIMGRIFMNNWGLPNLLLCLAGVYSLTRRDWRICLTLLVTWLGFTFYALNYYVPDVSVFLLPAHLVMAITWALGLDSALDLVSRSVVSRSGSLASRIPWQLVSTPVISIALVPSLLGAAGDWSSIDRSQQDGLTAWGTGVLHLPLATDATILADSEKIAPLLYLQQSEGMRPDLNIMVLPDEAAYRAELDARVAAGQTVYLARFLPGLEGAYHLHSIGPLTEVAAEPLITLPRSASPVEIGFGPILLIGYELEEIAMIDALSSSVTLYWQGVEPVSQPLLVYLRWTRSEKAGEPADVVGQHPANNYYPTNAWKGDEIVPDFRLLARPIGTSPEPLQLQVALAPAFTSPANLAWQDVVSVEVPPVRELSLGRVVRSQVGAALIAAAQFPATVRPQAGIPLILSGSGDPDILQFSLRPIGEAGSNGPGPEAKAPPTAPDPFVYATRVSSDVSNGRYQLIASSRESGAYCGWLSAASDGCPLGDVEVSGVPLPAGAANFDDKVALLSMEFSPSELRPSGRLQVVLKWQALGTMDEDYTIFIQVLDAQDRLGGQVDAWPLQGTYPTSQWSTGEVISDAHVLPLDSSLTPGTYRLQVGWYLLSTLRRLPVLDPDGNPTDDKVMVPGLVAPGSGD